MRYSKRESPSVSRRVQSFGVCRSSANMAVRVTIRQEASSAAVRRATTANYAQKVGAVLDYVNRQYVKLDLAS